MDGGLLGLVIRLVLSPTSRPNSFKSHGLAMAIAYLKRAGEYTGVPMLECISKQLNDEAMAFLFVIRVNAKVCLSARPFVLPLVRPALPYHSGLTLLYPTSSALCHAMPCQ